MANETIEQFKKLQAEALAKFKEKNADYGDSFREHGSLGVMVRILDKLNRIINLAREHGERAVKDESLRDTLIDLSNYALMCILAHEGGQTWEDKLDVVIDYSRITPADAGRIKKLIEDALDGALAGGFSTVRIGIVPPKAIDSNDAEISDHDREIAGMIRDAQHKGALAKGRSGN